MSLLDKRENLLNRTGSQELRSYFIDSKDLPKTDAVILRKIRSLQITPALLESLEGKKSKLEYVPTLTSCNVFELQYKASSKRHTAIPTHLDLPSRKLLLYEKLYLTETEDVIPIWQDEGIGGNAHLFKTRKEAFFSVYKQREPITLEQITKKKFLKEELLKKNALLGYHFTPLIKKKDLRVFPTKRKIREEKEVLITSKELKELIHDNHLYFPDSSAGPSSKEQEISLNKLANLYQVTFKLVETTSIRPKPKVPFIHLPNFPVLHTRTELMSILLEIGNPNDSSPSRWKVSNLIVNINQLISFVTDFYPYTLVNSMKYSSPRQRPSYSSPREFKTGENADIFLIEFEKAISFTKSQLTDSFRQNLIRNEPISLGDKKLSDTEIRSLRRILRVQGWKYLEDIIDTLEATKNLSRLLGSLEILKVKKVTLSPLEDKNLNLSINEVNQRIYDQVNKGADITLLSADETFALSQIRKERIIPFRDSLLINSCIPADLCDFSLEFVFVKF